MLNFVLLGDYKIRLKMDFRCRGWPDSQEKRKHIELLNVTQVQETDPETQISCHCSTGRITFDKFICSCLHVVQL